MTKRIVAAFALVALAVFLVGGMKRVARRWQFQPCCGSGTQIEVQTWWWHMDGLSLVRGFVDHPESPFAPGSIYVERRLWDNPMNDETWRARCTTESTAGTGEWYTFSQLPEVCPPGG